MVSSPDSADSGGEGSPDTLGAGGSDLRVGSIVVHCFEFEKMLAFWRAALGYVPRDPPSDGWVVLRDPGGRGPNLSLQARKTRPKARPSP